MTAVITRKKLSANLNLYNSDDLSGSDGLQITMESGHLVPVLSLTSQQMLRKRCLVQTKESGLKL